MMNVELSKDKFGVARLPGLPLYSSFIIHTSEFLVK